ncbi:hypothetical protein K1719_038142 [Acacia pycnantha]|nr:hypothetical protein K1719_038142 [Acacia pycnantha]
MAVTKDAIAHFDWSSFIIQELCEEIQEFKKDSQKSKTIKTRTVGGCLYFLMLFCFQHFPLGDVIPSPHRSPMAFWTDKNVKRRVSVEKRSKKVSFFAASLVKNFLGHRHICFSGSAIDIRTAAIQLATRNAWRFKDTLSEEARHEGEATYNRPTTFDESDDDDGDGHDTEEEEHRVEGDDIIDIEEDTQHGEETPTHVDGGLGGEQEVKEPDQDVKEPALELRRSQRVVIPSSVLKSPWIEPKRKSKGKRTYDEKDTLFEMCTKSVPRDEAAEEFVDMHHYFLTREELQCLTPRSWINNKLMTMVAKTLVAGKFFPKKLDTTLLTVISYLAPHSSLITGFVMYWIQEQWFSTLLDSLVEHELIIGCNMKRRIQLHRNHFLAILRTLKPELLQDDHKIPKDVTWAKVHVQPDTHSCGVHVLTWLQMWDGSSKERMGTQCHSTRRRTS